MRTGVQLARPLTGQGHCDSGADQHQRRGREQVEGREPDLTCTEFLAEVLRRPADIRPATNTVMTARISIPYRPEPVPPGAISPSIMFSSVIAPPRLV